MKVPHPRTYWVQEGEFLAGCYPATAFFDETVQHLANLISAGVRCFIDLTNEGEVDPHEQYQDILQQMSLDTGIGTVYHHFPVEDLYITTEQAMQAVLDCIDHSIYENQQPVYVHCRLGIGRTGMAVGCWLIRHQKATAENVLDVIARLRRNEPTRHIRSPETQTQIDFVRRWQQNFTSTKGENMKPTPYPRSYWVYEDKLLAGFYPGSDDPVIMHEKLSALLDAGIRCVVNLMEAHEVDHHGKLFVRYAPVLEKLAEQRGEKVSYHNFPIPDQDITTPENMQQIIATINHAIFEQNTPVYVHCWGGKGRTGTVVGCWLTDQKLAVGQAALEMVQSLRQNDPHACYASPETDDQIDFVLDWEKNSGKA